MVPPSIITRTPRALWLARLVAVFGLLVGGVAVTQFLRLASNDLRGQSGPPLAAGVYALCAFTVLYVGFVVWLIERTLLAAVEAAHADRAVARAVALVAEMDDQSDHRARRLSLEQQLDDLQAADGL